MKSARSLFALVLLVSVGPAEALGGCDGEIRLVSDGGATVAPGTDGGAPDSAGGPGTPAQSDCSVTQCRFGHCEPVGKVCVECLMDADCTTDGRRRCDVAGHRCVACGLDSDCESTNKCETTTHRCLPRCGSCPSDAPTCDSARGICVACTGPEGCSSDRVCDVAGGRCVECVSDAQCIGDKHRCDPVSGLCVACITSSDCSESAPTCDPAQLECSGN